MHVIVETGMVMKTGVIQGLTSINKIEFKKEEKNVPSTFNLNELLLKRK